MQAASVLPKATLRHKDTLSGQVGTRAFMLNLFDLVNEDSESEKVVFSGYVFSCAAPDGLLPVIIRPRRNKIARAVVESFGGNHPMPVRREQDLPPPLDEMAVFHRGEGDIVPTLSTLLDIRKRLPGPASFQALVIESGRLSIVGKMPSDYFQLEVRGASKVQILGEIGRISSRFTLPLDLLRAVHGGTP